PRRPPRARAAVPTRRAPFRCRTPGWASRRKHACGQVTVAAIADDEDDRRVRHFARDAQRDDARATRGDAAKNSFLRRESPRHLLGVGLRDRLDPVDAGGIVDFRQVGLRPLADAGDLRAFLGLCAYDADRGILLLEEARYAHD